MKLKYTPFCIIAAAVLGFAPLAQGQSSLRKANKLYNNFEYTLALQEYQEAILKRKPELETAERIATSYRLTRQTEAAENWYGKVVAMTGRNPINLYYYAEALRSNGKYKEANEQYMQWAEEMPEQADRAQALMEATDQSIRWMSQPPVAEVTALPALSMNGFADFSPAAYGANGVVFTSDRGVSKAGKGAEVYGWTGRPYLQLFVAQQNEAGDWAKPEALQDVINTDYHNATAAAAKDGSKLYFTRTKQVPALGSVNADPTSWVKKDDQSDMVNRLEIFSAEKQGGSWSNIQPFTHNKVEEYSVGHPALSPDGKVLYFASDMPGGAGETDIYYSTLQADGSWGQPVNAGTVVNTAGRESFPYVDANGKLYFASDGHIGMGGMDMFSAEGETGKWRAAKNLGYPINSPKNDFGLLFTEPGTRGLLSSNRDSQNGTEDIYAFNVLQKPVVLAITTLGRFQNNKKKTVQEPLPETRVLAARKATTDSSVFITDANAKHFMDARTGNTYVFKGSKIGFLNMESGVAIPATAPDTVQVALIFDKNEVEKAIVLDNIYYDLDKWDIRADAAKELDKLATLLMNNPSVNIELSAHTDSRESQEYNQQLSEKRAKAAVDYLVTKGIEADRLTWKGYGKTRLVNKCATGVNCPEEEHQKNRRTEFTIKKN
ncbi:OmpA family protein [Pontibacter akesuensis]|uniref:WD40-like Beta Propeller Repeat n=1 Tax=Pontibacter akesuensis TaxID=388950 RepID=A0A1I7HQG9_9BACT|nr:OmpA family protein [Pontibacter akesuensis]GHA63035.1 cell envelope biogenesis protein OmpA [Pontibacter akesuensis]SFU62879.1 WD40-like Beta Propeller Repeat [Pontibacter akesuensis]